MQLFFHHVGVEGASRDFPRTVFAKKNISIVEDSLPESYPDKQLIIHTLKKEFPIGYFNCWGVPGKARMVINRLRPGDAVIMIESTKINGLVPALGIVKAYWPVTMPHLSYELWNDEKYPYIFFFDTVELNLKYSEFFQHLGYSPNYEPRGHFNKAGVKAFPLYRPFERYIELLRSKYAK